MLFRKANSRQTDTGDAERILTQSYETLRQHQPGEPTPLSFMRTRLQAKAAQPVSRKDSAMSKAAQIFKSRPKLSVTAIAAVAVFLYVTLEPFSYTTTVGYTVSFTDTEQQISIDPNQFVAAMSALGYDNVTANYNSNGVQTVWDLKGLPDRQGALAAATAFRTLTQSDLEPTITPVTREVSGTLYAQVKEQLQELKISIDEASSPEEIEAQIRAQLIAAGFEPGNVHVTTNEEDGTVTIDLEISQ